MKSLYAPAFTGVGVSVAADGEGSDIALAIRDPNHWMKAVIYCCNVMSTDTATFCMFSIENRPLKHT